MKPQHEQQPEEDKDSVVAGPSAAAPEEELRVPLLDEAARARSGLPETAPPHPAGTPSQQAGTSTSPTPTPAGFHFAWPQVFQSSESLGSGVEDAGSFWRKQRLLMMVWLGTSITGFLSLVLLDPGSGVLIMAKLAAILAMIPPLCYLFPSCSGSLDLPTQTKLTAMVGKVSGCLNMVTLGFFGFALLTLTTVCKSSPPYIDEMGNDMPPCGVIWGLLAFFAVVLGGHAWLSMHMSRRAESAQMLLNPVSSGMVHV